MLGGGRGSSRRRITQLASNGTPRLSLPTGEVDAFVSVERAAAFRRNLSVAVRANEDQQSTRRARLFALPRRSARGHEDQFPTPRLSTRFSIAVNVKPRPINSYRPPSCASAHLSHGALASLRDRRQAASRWDEKDGEAQSVGRRCRRLAAGSADATNSPHPVVPVRTSFCRSRTR